MQGVVVGSTIFDRTRVKAHDVESKPLSLRIHSMNERNAIG